LSTLATALPEPPPSKDSNRQALARRAQGSRCADRPPPRSGTGDRSNVCGRPRVTFPPAPPLHQARTTSNPTLAGGEINAAIPEGETMRLCG